MSTQRVGYLVTMLPTPLPGDPAATVNWRLRSAWSDGLGSKDATNAIQGIEVTLTGDTPQE